MPDTATARKPAAPKKAKTTAKKGSNLTPAQVLAYLRAHPGFFEKHKAGLEHFVTPKKGGNILSLHALRADKLARTAENLKTRQKQLISMAQGNTLVAESIFTAALQLIRCRTTAQLRKTLQTGIAETLDLTAVRLFAAGGEETATTLTARQIEGLCPRPVTLAPLDAAAHRILFGPKTNGLKSVCLMPLHNESGTLIGLLAMASADAARFHAGQATNLAGFLGQVTATVYAHANAA